MRSPRRPDSELESLRFYREEFQPCEQCHLIGVTPERAFQFAYGPDDDQNFGAFLAAHAELFPPIADKLSLPLETRQLLHKIGQVRGELCLNR